MILYRPVGQRELELIEESGRRAFPPRLPEQPVFYPVKNIRYAREIAERWNTKDARSGCRGYVTQFEVEDGYISGFEPHIVGGSWHEEYWIPAEELAEFNRHIVGEIQVVDSFGLLSEAHARYLQKLVEQAGNVDENCAVFGADCHQYRLNPPLPLQEVRSFEERYHLKLPEEYVFFLTMVGNGGAGPYYGIYPLDKLPLYTEYLSEYTGEESRRMDAWIGEALTKQDWAAVMEELEEAGDDAYDEIMKRVCAGLLVIGTQGCTYDNLLMWKGSEAGRIIYIDWNLEPECGPVLTHMTFLEWYERYFEEIIAGHNVTTYGYYSLKTEKELRADYLRAERPEEKKRILLGFYKFNQAEEETVRFLTGLSDQEFDGMRVELLLRFDEAAGLRVFEELLGGENLNGAVRCARRLPEPYKDRYYGRMTAFLNRPDILNKENVLFFLHDCGCRRARDIVAFAMDGGNSGELRRTAVWVMGTCPDKMDFLPQLTALMRGESYQLAHAALQAVSRTPCEALLDTYRWMWEKYKRDDMMRANLIIAFRENGIEKG